MWAPHSIELQCGDKKFSDFVSFPLCSFSSKCHHETEVKHYLKSLEVKGKVSVLMGLASASANYNRHDETSSDRELKSFSCSIYARKGFLVPGKELVEYSDKGMNFNLESIEIGLEEILIVSMEYERDDSKTEEKLEIKVKVLFFTISSKMESIHQSSSQKGFVRIDHYSSKTGKWRQSEFGADRYREALAEVQRIEEEMLNIAKTVNDTPNHQLSRLHFVVRPRVEDTKNVALYVELYNVINYAKMQLAELQVAKTNTADKTKELQSILCTLQSLTIEDCSWVILGNIKRQIQKVRK